MAKVKINVLSFTRQENPESYVDWEEKCDQIFCIHDFSDAKRVKLAFVEFSGYALTWWNQLQEALYAAGNDHISTWDGKKRAMRRRFIPQHYQRDLHNRLQCLSQGSRTIDNYYKEMEVLLIRARIQESDEARMARFLRGLNEDIVDDVELYPYNTLQELVHQAMRVEKRNQHCGQSHSFLGHPAVPSWRRR